MKKTLKWQMIWNYGEPVDIYVPLMREIQFGIFKLKELPHEGQRIGKRDYKGFLITIRFHIPFEIK